MSRFLVFCTLLFLVQTSLVSAGEPVPSESRTAAEVDRLLLEHLAAESVSPAAITTDEDFLRRVSLDLTGQLPSPSEVTLFGLSTDPQKRTHVIDTLLASPDYGELWASYWKDVIFLRATEARSRLAQPTFEKWMIEQLNSNRPWDEVTRDLITATGNVREDGQTGLIFAHGGSAEELAAEISRIFLGIQISCANCHHHPTDSWKREQFHGLAAFLPRIKVRPEKTDGGRTFHVVSFDQGARKGQKKNIDPNQMFQNQDRNRDGKLSKTEVRGPLAKRFDQIVTRFDANKDGLLSKKEFKAVQERGNQQQGRGSNEYYMPDLQNPASKGTLTQPEFFISTVNGPHLKSGSKDQDRRTALADFITSPSNPWFARAIVNRLWAEMLGEGFYMPIDDMGPQRSATDEDVLQLLADEFVASGYDLKWLLRTITLTNAYQRQLAANSDEAIPAAFASASSTRLRSDQIYNSITSVLGTSANLQGRGRGQNAKRMQAAGIDPQKARFSVLFGFDPSTPQVDLLGNVPQALYMMNSPQLDNQIRGSGGTRLARILENQKNNEDALGELYLLVLSRNPSVREMEINSKYIKSTGNRQEAFEDIMWSLMNSAEFLSKR